MMTVVDPGLQRALRRAAVAGTRAWSVLDTQPWRIVVRRASVEVHADRARQLRRLDPDARALIFSCGCALANVRLSLTADGLGTRVTRFPDVKRRDLVATIDVLPGEPPAGDPLEATLGVAVIDNVRSIPPRSPGPQAPIAETSSILVVGPAIRSGVEALIRQSVERVRSDPSASVEAGALPAPLLPADPAVWPIPSVGVVVEKHDSPAGWVRAGERYQQLNLDLALVGEEAIAMPFVTAYADLRSALRTLLDTDDIPQLTFRAMKVRSTRPTRPQRRRRLVDTLVEGS